MSRTPTLTPTDPLTRKVALSAVAASLITLGASLVSAAPAPAPATPATPPAATTPPAPAKPPMGDASAADPATSEPPPLDQEAEAMPKPSSGIATTKATTEKPDVVEPAPAAKAPEVEKRPAGPLPPLHSMIRLELALEQQWNDDPGYDLFDEDDVGVRGSVRAEVDLLELGADALLALQLGYTAGITDDGWLGPALSDAEWVEQRPFIGVVPRYRLLSWLGLHARLHGGASFSTVRVTALQRLVAEDVAPHVGAGAGFSVHSPPNRTSERRAYFNSISAGVQLEGGYSMAPALELRLPTRDASPPDRQLSQTGAYLGSLDRAGPYIVLSGFVRF